MCICSNTLSCNDMDEARDCICSNTFDEIIALSIVHSPPSDAEVFGIILKSRKGRVRHMRYFEQLPWVHEEGCEGEVSRESCNVWNS